MFGHYTYLGYDFLFTAPFIVFLFLRGRDAVKKHVMAIASTTVLLTLYGAFFLWPLGLREGTWQYNPDKILGIMIFGAYSEDILWWFLTALLFSLFVAVSFEREEAGRSFIGDEMRGFCVSVHFAYFGFARFFEERNLAIMASVGIGAVIVAVFSGLLLWAALVLFTVCSVLAIEMMNSAVESVADAVASGQNPLVKKAKDAMAAASLMASFGALVVGILFLRVLFFGE